MVAADPLGLRGGGVGPEANQPKAAARPRLINEPAGALPVFAVAEL
jgi:hypothetical protein